MTNPKAFMSYSWTSPDHEAWVLNLATELREQGVDVILDKWDLKEGHDAIAFMEQIVTNSELKKVILVCDHKYAEKTDGRAGGVGTEAQIISPAIYAKTDQNKFVAVTTEMGPDGKPFLPTYYMGRIYIDLSNDEIYAQNFEQLVRWVYDKPVHLKPALGKAPAYLSEISGPTLGNAALHRRALDAIRSAKPFAKGAIDEYLESSVAGLEAFRIAGGDQDFDDQVAKSIQDFLPYRAQLVELFVALAQYQDTPETRQQLHRFFERVLPFFDAPGGMNQYREWDFDNFRFIIGELFLYCVAILLKYEAFDFAATLMRQPFFVPAGPRGGQSRTEHFNVFRPYLKSLEHRNARLKLDRLSLHADMLEQRSHASGVHFQEVMQADFTLYLRSCFDALGGVGDQWWPYTLLYARGYGPFEIFARARSKEYFANVARLFDIKSKEEFEPVFKAIKEEKLFSLRKRELGMIDPASLIAFDKLATTA